MSNPVYKMLRGAKVLKTTEKAYLLDYRGFNFWLPISLASSIYPDYGRGTLDIVIPIWYATKKGIAQL